MSITHARARMEAGTPRRVVWMRAAAVVLVASGILDLVFALARWTFYAPLVVV